MNLCFKKSLLVLIILYLWHAYSISQDYSWWNRKVGWDGHRHWRQYLIFAPGYFGPNALPVPLTGKGYITRHFLYEQSFDFHFNNHEKTTNAYLRFFFPVSNNKAAFEVAAFPVEYYSYDTVVRDERRSRDKDGKGFSAGDIYVISHFQLLQHNGFSPNMMLTAGIKTASGGNSQAVRFTDVPAYYFYGSFGWPLSYHFGGDSAYYYGMSGFYSWQTYNDKYFQNDAYLFGMGISVYMGKWELGGEIAGYLGYTGTGDQPVVARLFSNYSHNNLSYGVMFQQGVHHYRFSTLRFTMVYRFNKMVSDIRNFLVNQN